MKDQTDLTLRKAVFKDTKNTTTNTGGVMRTSVTYNAGLGRYILTTQQVKRTTPGAYIGIYDAPNPWGPWTTVLFADAQTVGLQGSGDPKTVFWNFSNKWTSSDGKNSVIVYTSDDILATANATFTTSPITATNTPTPTSTGPSADANGDSKIDGRDLLAWIKNYGKNLSGPVNGDFDKNNTVNLSDYRIWINSY